MKHKLWLIMLTFVTSLCLAFGLSACGFFGLTEPEGPGGEQGGKEPETPHVHVMTEHGKVEPTCTTEGTKQYWSCSVCELNFADKEGKTQLDELSIPALGHDMTKHEAKEATETEDGNNEYWECGRCEQYFSDAKGEQPIEDKSSVVIPAKNHVHEPIRHEAQEPTCTEGGNELYFECKNCHALFLDESCTEKTTLAAVQKQATGHKAKSEWEQGEATHYHVCDVCGEKLSDTESAHDFGTAWESDEKGHWQICAVCGKKGNEAPHDFGTGNVCTTCNYTEKAPSEGLLYQLNEDRASYSVVGLGSCQDIDLVIPSTHGDFPVISIGLGAFKGCDGLTSVTIGSGVTSIGNVAFEDCSGLTGVTMGSGVTSIGNDAFNGCSGLTSVTMGSGVTSIGSYAFSGTAYYNDNSNWDESGVLYIGSYLIAAHNTISGSYTIRANTKLIADRTFSGCSGLTSITIPDSVTSIGSDAFYGCSGLESITIGSSVTSIGSKAFYGTAYYNDPSNWDENGVLYLDHYIIEAKDTISGRYSIRTNTKLIADSAFSGCSGLTSITIPDSVTSIGSNAFNGCSGLTSVTIPDSVTSIGDSAFRGCSRLTSIEIPDSVTSIGENAFQYCSGLKSVTIGSGVTSIGENAFQYCSGLMRVDITDLSAWCRIVFGDEYANPLNYARNLFLDSTQIEDLTIPSEIKEIKAYAFYGSWLKRIAIPDGVTSIGDSAFRGCSWLKNVTIMSGMTSIGDYAFYDCSGLTSVTIPDSVITIGRYAFSGCSGLTGIEIPDSVTEIGEGAFYKCYGLTSVTIGSGVTSIEMYAFEDCSGLKEVHITDLAAWCRIDFGSYDANPLFYAHHLYLDGDEVKDLTIPSEITEIKQYAFYVCDGLTSVTIPDSVTSIGERAFWCCGGLSGELKIPDSVTSIGEEAFYGTASYNGSTNWDENGVLYIGNYLIKAKTTISGSYTIRPDTKVIADEAFFNCKKLNDISIPDGVTSIGDSAFDGCSGLTSITIPDSVTSIGDSAFDGCSGLKSVTIGSGVTSIGSSAFYVCSGVKEVHISDLTAWCRIDFGDEDANPISNHILYLNGDEVKNLTIPSEITEIKKYAFYEYGWLSGELKIPDSVTSIGEGAFAGCSLKSVTIGNGLTSIGSYAFESCYGLTSITIPDSVTSIGEGAFAGCSLKSVTIGNGLTSIGSYAFRYCSELETVYYKGTAEEWRNISINNTHSYNSYLLKATRYYFTEDAPTAEEWASYDYWWHYDPDTSLPTPWVKDQ